MSLLHKSRNVIPVLLALLCLVPLVNAPRPAAAADDNASTQPERQAKLAQLQAEARLRLGRGETLEAARILNQVGRLQLILNDPKAALASHIQALDLLKQTPSSETQVDNLIGLAAACIPSGENERAEAALRQALNESEGSHYLAGQAEALLILSGLQNEHNHVEAVKTAQDALARWQAVDNKTGVTRTYDKLSQYYLAQNLLNEATESSRRALQGWQELGNKAGQAAALVVLGFIEFRRGSWQDAIAYHTQAQQLIDEHAEPKTMGQIEVGLAEAFNESGLPEAGIVHFQKAEAYYRQTQNPAFVAHAIRGVGRSLYLLGNYDEATNQFYRSLAEVPADSLYAAQSQEDLGRVLISKQEYPRALDHLQSALATYVRDGNPREAAQAQGLIAEIYERQGLITQSRQYYERSLQTFVKLSHHLNQAAILYGLGRLELGAGNYDAAENYLRRSIAVTEDVRRVSTSRDLMAAFSATVYARYQAYIECLMRKHEAQPYRGFAVSAFESSESERGRSLAELLRATQTNLVPGLEPQLAQQEKSIRQTIRVKEDYRVTLLSTQYQRQELDSLDKDLSSLKADYKKVDEAIRLRYPAYGQITEPTRWSLQKIQQEVIADDQTMLLEYSLGKETSYVWAVTRDSFRSYELPAQERITEAAQKVYALLTAPNPVASEAALAQATRELSQMVLSPVSGQLNKDRIIVVADGALNYIPLQLLIAPGGNEEPLVASHEVINAPSASILGQLRAETARRQAPRKILAAFGDPVFQSNYAQKKASGNEQVAALSAPENVPWTRAVRDISLESDSIDPVTIEPLFYSRMELSNLRTIAGPETLMVTGFEATRAKLAAVNLSEYAILHIATHGFLDPKRPEKSGLFLSMVDLRGQPLNGVVGLQDIYGLRAPVDLVVLSACRTGLGKDVRGEGLIGLTRGFMYAGASSVMASLWKVDDEATAELMKRFYANMLPGGMTPAAALRAAQNSIRQEPQWRSPYFWAAFTLQGEYRQVIKYTPAQPFPASVRIAIALSLVLLLAAGIRWYRRGGLMHPR